MQVNLDKCIVLDNHDGTYKVQFMQTLKDEITGKEVNGTFTIPRCSVEIDKNGETKIDQIFEDTNKGKTLFTLEVDE